MTAAIIAGTHPTDEFHGIDAFPPHIERARELCDNARIANLTLHARDFASAIDLDLPCFDSIVAHGVYSWIDSSGRDDMRRFIDAAGAAALTASFIDTPAEDSAHAQLLANAVALLAAGEIRNCCGGPTCLAPRNAGWWGGARGASTLVRVPPALPSVE